MKELIILKPINNETQKIKIIDGYEYINCPVCGTLTMVYDICERCGWQNTGESNIDGGPNHMTLKQAREAYKKGEPIN